MTGEGKQGEKRGTEGKGGKNRSFFRSLSNWTKIFTVIASEGKQSQPLELLHLTSFHIANATLTQ